MAELLLELLSEEIPARLQRVGTATLERLLVEILAEHDLSHGPVHGFATPRRLVVVVEDVPPGQPDREIERRGPRVDAPEKAREGFLRGLGDAAYELSEIDDRKGRFLLARYREAGRPTAAILAERLPAALARFDWPKSMRWADRDERWVRPLKNLLCVFGGKIVPFTFAGIVSGDTSHGHRFMAPQAFQARSFDVLATGLAERSVILDPLARRGQIESAAHAAATSAGFRLRDDPGLLDELTGLVEWPVPMLGRIDAEFMALPVEVLVTSMREHQKYLALETPDGQLAPAFIAVANIAASDGGKAIIAGNERVLRARLWDARFFWEQDRKRRLEDRLSDLEPMIFHEKLGSLRDKAARLERLTGTLATTLGGDAAPAVRAGLLAKTDLVTGMVGEFPELQGIMGGHYARAEGLADEIADAITGQYRFAGDAPLEGGVTGCALALADKLDTLTGFFMAGIRPTGSKDPFALRRAAAGISWVIRRHGLRLPLRDAILTAIDLYPAGLLVPGTTRRELAEEILAFIKHRGGSDQVVAEVALRVDYPFNIPSIFQAVLSSDDDDLVRLDRLRTALLDLLATDDGRSLIAAYRRAGNILRIEAKKDGVAGFPVEPEATQLTETAERYLFERMNASSGALNAAMNSEDYQVAMRALADLRPAIDGFFDQVMVNADDPRLRANRLALLAQFGVRADRIVDFSLIED